MEENVRSMIVAAGGSGMLGLLEKAGGEKELTIRTLDTLIRAAIEDRVKPEKGWERTTELCRLVLRYAEEFQSGSVNRLLQWEDEKLVTAAAENCCDAVLETARSILSLACRNETGSA